MWHLAPQAPNLCLGFDLPVLALLLWLCPSVDVHYHRPWLLGPSPDHALLDSGHPLTLWSRPLGLSDPGQGALHLPNPPVDL